MSYFANFPKLIYSTSLGIKNFKLVPNILARVNFLKGILTNTQIYYSYDVKEEEKPEDVAFRFYQDPMKHWIILLANEIIDPQYDWPMSERNLNEFINKKYSSYELLLDSSEIYSDEYQIGEIAYQGSTIDASYFESTVVSYNNVDRILTVNSISDVFANNTTITGASSGVSHKIVGTKCNNDGLIWSQTNISHYQVTEVKRNSYDEIETTESYTVSIQDYNHSSGDIIPRVTESDSYQLNDGSVLSINREFSPVYYYDYEVQKNESRRKISVPRPEYVSRIEEQFKRIMS